MLIGGTIFAGAQSSVFLLVVWLIPNRYLTLVRNAFAGIPTLYEEKIPQNYYMELTNTSDIL